MTAATRTQLLRAGFIDGILRDGRYRLVAIRDHEGLARSLPGTRPGFIPSGLYGPGRRIPREPVPTLTVTQLLVARGDVPARVVRDILEVIYDPRFARDLQIELREESRQNVGGVPLHTAARIHYHRNDLPSSHRLARDEGQARRGPLANPAGLFSHGDRPACHSHDGRQSQPARGSDYAPTPGERDPVQC